MWDSSGCPAGHEALWGLLLLQPSTAVQVRSSVRLMPQIQQSSRGLLPSPTAWSPDNHLAALLADVSRYILGRTEGLGLGFGIVGSNPGLALCLYRVTGLESQCGLQSYLSVEAYKTVIADMSPRYILHASGTLSNSLPHPPPPPKKKKNPWNNKIKVKTQKEEYFPLKCTNSSLTGFDFFTGIGILCM